MRQVLDTICRSKARSVADKGLLLSRLSHAGVVEEISESISNSCPCSTTAHGWLTFIWPQFRLRMFCKGSLGLWKERMSRGAAILLGYLSSRHPRLDWQANQNGRTLSSLAHHHHIKINTPNTHTLLPHRASNKQSRPDINMQCQVQHAKLQTKRKFCRTFSQCQLKLLSQGLPQLSSYPPP